MTNNYGESPQKEPYIGSVRFYKNMILVFVLILIAVPTIFAIVFHNRLNKLEQQEPEAVEETQTEDATESEAIMTRQITVTDASGNSIQIEVPVSPSRESTPLAASQTEVLPYQELYPDMYAPQELDASQRYDASVFLTYEGEISGVTNRLLDLLAEKNCKATFFIQGEPVGEAVTTIETMADHGHTVGMMGCSREYDKLYASVDAYLDDLYVQFAAIKEITGVAPTMVRLPGGSVNAYNMTTYREIIAELLRRGFVPCDWNVVAGDDTADEEKTATDIATSTIIRAENYSRAVIQLHQTQACERTVEATEIIINSLRNDGYTFRAFEPDTMTVLFAYPDYKEDIVYEQ